MAFWGLGAKHRMSRQRALISGGQFPPNAYCYAGLTRSSGSRFWGSLCSNFFAGSPPHLSMRRVGVL
jgi:hypothetical protein